MAAAGASHAFGARSPSRPTLGLPFGDGRRDTGTLRKRRPDRRDRRPGDSRGPRPWRVRRSPRSRPTDSRPRHRAAVGLVGEPVDRSGKALGFGRRPTTRAPERTQSSPSPRRRRCTSRGAGGSQRSHRRPQPGDDPKRTVRRAGRHPRCHLGLVSTPAGQAAADISLGAVRSLTRRDPRRRRANRRRIGKTPSP